MNHVAKTITLHSGFSVSPGAVFPVGSVCEEVPLITYAVNEEGITRDSGYGPVLLARNSTLELEYLDMNGNPMSLPLTNADVINALRSIRITIELTSESNLRSGEPFVATVSQVFGIRNLNYVF